MCLKTGNACDCYECVETSRGRGPEGNGRRENGPGQDILGIWRDAFQQAYREVQVEIFKSKIKARMSKPMEKTAELVLESMIEQIEENARRAKFEKGFREKFEDLAKAAQKG